MIHPALSVNGSRHVTVDTDDGIRPAGPVVPAAPEAGQRPPTSRWDSAPGRWYTRETLPMRRVHRLLEAGHLRALVRAAGPTTTAWVVPGVGHARSGATAPLVERGGRWVSATIGP